MHVSKAHIVWLIAGAALLTVLGLLFAVAPGGVIDQIGIEGSDRLSGLIRVAGSVLLAEAFVVSLAVRSRNPIEIRLVTVLLVVHFAIETVIRIISLSMGESDNPIAAIPQAAICIGLALQLRMMSRQPAAEPTMV